jgi:hypothetical protein
VAGLTPEQHRAEIEADLADARAANEHKAERKRPELEQARLDLLIADLEHQLATLRMPHLGLNELLKPASGDSLTSIGNFLGTNPATEANSMLKESKQLLQQINNGVQDLRRNATFLQL